jgi:hypothetical protein
MIECVKDTKTSLDQDRTVSMRRYSKGTRLGATMMRVDDGEKVRRDGDDG